MIHIGLVGCGKMGSIWKKNIEANPYCKLAWISDPAIAGSQNLQSAKCDLAIIASPTLLHGAHSVWFLSQSTPTMVEKPLALTLETAEFMAKHPGVFMSAPVRYTAEGLDFRLEGATFIRVSDAKEPNKYGGPAFDLGIHDLDLAISRGLAPERAVGATGDTGYSFYVGSTLFEGCYGATRRAEFIDNSRKVTKLTNRLDEIARQLQDFIVFYQTGTAPSRLCTAKQAVASIRILDELSKR